jgi:hypothetical protein
VVTTFVQLQEHPHWTTCLGRIYSTNASRHSDVSQNQLLINGFLTSMRFIQAVLTEESGQMIVSGSLADEVSLPKQLEGGFWAGDCELQLGE